MSNRISDSFSVIVESNRLGVVSEADLNLWNELCTIRKRVFEIACELSKNRLLRVEYQENSDIESFHYLYKTIKDGFIREGDGLSEMFDDLYDDEDWEKAEFFADLEEWDPRWGDLDWDDSVWIDPLSELDSEISE
jgi:hypothetical protein